MSVKSNIGYSPGTGGRSKGDYIMDIFTIEILIVSAMIVIAVTELLKLVVIEIIEEIILYKRRKRRRWK